jgi:formate hydrogenlyase subunit 6/NADH:ubiquinone oxidoreductase subunit I
VVFTRHLFVRVMIVASVFVTCGSVMLFTGCSDSVDKVSVSGAPSQPAVTIDAKACIACAGRYCWEACPKRAVDELTVDKQIIYVIDTEKCIRCGVCIGKCPYGAVVWRR